MSALTTMRGLIPSLIARDWVFVGFDLVMLVTAALLALAARKIVSYSPKVASRGKTRSPLEASR
jgi:hypothetical protein